MKVGGIIKRNYQEEISYLQSFDKPKIFNGRPAY